MRQTNNDSFTASCFSCFSFAKNGERSYECIYMYISLKLVRMNVMSIISMVCISFDSRNGIHVSMTGPGLDLGARHGKFQIRAVNHSIGALPSWKPREDLAS